jgi:hypothetical protein
MKHFPKPLISFRKLQGGQFGTLDVSATDPHYVQLALGTDFIQVTRSQWIALRSTIDRFFGCETETVVLVGEDGEAVIFEEREEELDDDEEEFRPPPPPPRNRQQQRRRSTAG